MKQNRILLNNAGRNHIKMFPMKDIPDVPLTEIERLEWCERTFNRLLNDRHANNELMEVNKRRGYLIAVWELDSIHYLIMSLRTNKGIFNNIVYMSYNKDDMLAIARFLIGNIEEVTNNFKNTIIKLEELADELARANREKQEDIQS